MDDYGTKVAVTLDSIREGRVYGNISLALGLYSLDEVRSAVSDGLVIVASEKSKFSDYFAELVLSWKSEIDKGNAVRCWNEYLPADGGATSAPSGKDIE